MILRTTFQRKERASLWREPWISATAMGATTSEDAYPGVVYAACTVRWGVDTQEYNGDAQSGVYIYRRGANQWTRIAFRQLNQLPDLSNRITDVALAVRGNDLWVFWIEMDEEEQNWHAHLFGRIIPNARTIGVDAIDFTNEVFGSLVPEGEPNSFPAGFEPEIDAAWDYDYNDVIQQPLNVPWPDAPRVIWKNYDTKDYIEESWIRLWPNGNPRELGGRLPVAQDPNLGFMTPYIAINTNVFIPNPRLTPPPEIAFASYKHNETGQWGELNDPGTLWGGPWGVPNNTGVYAAESPAVTRRAFGVPRFAFRGVFPDTSEYRLFTNTELINPYDLTIEGNFPRVTTNGASLRDVFVGYAGPDTVTLFHVDP